MILSIIVAASENNVIGKDNGLIWHLSADLKHFRRLTTGHTVIMGRKTWESIGKALPERRNIVVSYNADYQAEGCEVMLGIEEALEAVREESEVFIIGGGALYREVWDRADRLYLTCVHTVVEGDTLIPRVELSQWEMTERADFKADEKNEFDYSFIVYHRRRKE